MKLITKNGVLQIITTLVLMFVFIPILSYVFVHWVEWWEDLFGICLKSRELCAIGKMTTK